MIRRVLATARASFTRWARDLPGPRCPHLGCDHRARGWRTLAAHQDLHHPGAS